MGTEAAPQACDVICQAAQMGRLDLITALLAAIAILLALGGIFAFFDVRRAARATAEETAGEVSRSLAEAAAVEYLERELPRLVEIYSELARNAVADEDANAIAEAQDDGADESHGTAGAD